MNVATTDEGGEIGTNLIPIRIKNQLNSVVLEMERKRIFRPPHFGPGRQYIQFKFHMRM